MIKDEIRSQMRALRRALTSNDVKKKSELIYSYLLTDSDFKNARTVMIYISAFKEPDTLTVISDLISAGKRVIVPVSNTDTHTITLSYLDSMDNLKKGAYGIFEPVCIKEALSQDIDVIIVPGIAFDKSGNRLGFGKGYYDRLLSTVKAKKIGLCYAFQLLDAIPCDAHDIPMDLIITEEGKI